MNPELKSNYYQSITANRVILGEKVTEFRHFRLFQLSLIEITDTHLLFNYFLLSQKMEATALIHQWIKDIERIQSHLLLQTDIYGNFLGIQNFPELQKLWNTEYKSYLQKKYKQEGAKEMIEQTEQLLNDKKRFEEQFSGYNFLRTFFHGYYNQKEISPIKEVSIKNYFGEIDLNLIIQNNIENKTLTNSAILNKNTFNQKAFTRLIRNITHTIDAKAELEVDLEEIFSFDQDNWIEEASLFLETSVPILYYIITAHQIFKISEEEKNQLLGEWKYSNTIERSHGR